MVSPTATGRRIQIKNHLIVGFSQNVVKQPMQIHFRFFSRDRQSINLKYTDAIFFI